MCRRRPPSTRLHLAGSAAASTADAPWASLTSVCAIGLSSVAVTGCEAKAERLKTSSTEGQFLRDSDSNCKTSRRPWRPLAGLLNQVESSAP